MRSRLSDSASAWVRSVTTWSRLALMARSSLSAFSTLRAESQETRAMTKNPLMAGTLGIWLVAASMSEMMMLLMLLKMKLDQEDSRMLAMMIGMTKKNRLRPDDSSCGVSLNEKITVKKTRKTAEATRPDQNTLIK